MKMAYPDISDEKPIYNPNRIIIKDDEWMGEVKEVVSCESKKEKREESTVADDSPSILEAIKQLSQEPIEIPKGPEPFHLEE